MPEHGFAHQNDGSFYRQSWQSLDLDFQFLDGLSVKTAETQKKEEAEIPWGKRAVVQPVHVILHKEQDLQEKRVRGEI